MQKNKNYGLFLGKKEEIHRNFPKEAENWTYLTKTLNGLS